MNVSEVYITNPISHKSIEKLFNDIELCEASLLIVNTGDHDFESIDVLRELKLRFIKEEAKLNRFRRIAFIHPPEVSNKSENEERYNYFCSREEAIVWLLTEEPR